MFGFKAGIHADDKKSQFQSKGKEVLLKSRKDHVAPSSCLPLDLLFLVQKKLKHSHEKKIKYYQPEREFLVI